MIHLCKKNKKLLLCCLLLCMIFPSIYAQTGKETLTIKIDQIISKNYPDIRAYTVIENSKGESVSSVSPSLFQFRIDSMEVKTKTTITPFSMKEMPVDYVVLFSNNGIMDGEPLDFQKNAIIQFVDMLKPSDTLSLYTIGEEAVPLFEDMEKSKIDVGVINNVTASSAQPRVYDSIINVLRKTERKANQRKIVIVISDGRDQNSRFTKDQMHTIASESNIPIYAIGIRVLNMQSLSNLNELSDITGGTYIFANTQKEIPVVFKKIVNKIAQCYIIDISIKNMKADNMHHQLEVTVNERDAYGKGQKTFIAVKVPVPRWVKWAVLAAAVAAIAFIIILCILMRIGKRRRMGITRRRCPECGIRMKDTWDLCPFCKYMPDIKKKKKKKGKKNA